METTKRSYRDILRFFSAATSWQQRPDNAQETKRKYAISRVLKGVRKLVNDYNDKVTEVSVRHCEEDEKGRIATDDKANFIYKKSALGLRDKEMRELSDQEVEVEVYFERGKNTLLTPYEEEAFAGFIFPEPDEPSEDKPAS